MEGRPLGTERPSLSSPSATAGEDRAFRQLLESRAQASGRDVRQSIEDEVATRIRGGRTDAAAASDDKRDAVRDRDDERIADDDLEPERPEPEEARRREDDRGRERRDSGGSGARDDGGGRADDGAGEASDSAPTAPGAPAAHSNASAIERSSGGTAPNGPSQPTHAPAAAPGASAPAAAPSASGAARGLAIGGATSAAGGAQRGGALPAQASAPSAQRGAARTAQAQASGAPDRTAVERAEAVLDQLKARIRAGAREATIHLRPDDLGRIEMRVRVSADGVRAAMFAESPETLRVLEQHLPELKAWLARDSEGPVSVELTLLGDASEGSAERFGRDAGERPAGDQGAREQGRASGRSRPSRADAPTPAPDAPAASSPSSSGVDLVA